MKRFSTATLLAIATCPIAVAQDLTSETERMMGHPEAGEIYGRLPVSFEVNEGQTDAQVKFLTRGKGFTAFLTATEAVVVLQSPTFRAPRRPDGRPGEFQTWRSGEPSKQAVVRMKLLEAIVTYASMGSRSSPDGSTTSRAGTRRTGDAMSLRTPRSAITTCIPASILFTTALLRASCNTTSS